MIRVTALILRGAGTVMHIGCDSGAIEKPEYRDSLDIFDTDVISAYKFIKEIMNR